MGHAYCLLIAAIVVFLVVAVVDTIRLRRYERDLKARILAAREEQFMEDELWT